MEPAPHLRWKTLDDLEISLVAFQQMYAEQPSRRRELREIVIRNKDRARFASRNPKITAEKRAIKEEMVQWMLVWLDDPLMFPDWVVLRRARIFMTEPPG